MGPEAVLPYVMIGVAVLFLGSFFALGGFRSKPRTHWSDFDPDKMRKRPQILGPDGKPAKSEVDR